MPSVLRSIILFGHTSFTEVKGTRQVGAANLNEDGKELDSDWSVIILTGGRARRMGGLDKSEITLGAVSNFERILNAIPPATKVIAVGPSNFTRPNMFWCREIPNFGGPVAALSAALNSGYVTEERVVILAVDMPYCGEILTSLVQECTPEVDAVLAIDQAEIMQSLCGCYWVQPLENAMNSLSNVQGSSMRSIISMLCVKGYKPPDSKIGLIFDLDTTEDILTARSKIDWRNNMLNDWVELLREELKLSEHNFDVDALLDLTRIVAHNVERTAAPVTAFMLGLAASKGEDLKITAEQISKLAESWTDKQGITD